MLIDVNGVKHSLENNTPLTGQITLSDLITYARSGAPIPLKHSVLNQWGFGYKWSVTRLRRDRFGHNVPEE